MRYRPGGCLSRLLTGRMTAGRTFTFFSPRSARAGGAGCRFRTCDRRASSDVGRRPPFVRLSLCPLPCTRARPSPSYLSRLASPRPPRPSGPAVINWTGQEADRPLTADRSSRREGETQRGRNKTLAHAASFADPLAQPRSTPVRLTTDRSLAHRQRGRKRTWQQQQQKGKGQANGEHYGTADARTSKRWRGRLAGPLNGLRLSRGSQSTTA